MGETAGDAMQEILADVDHYRKLSAQSMDAYISKKLWEEIDRLEVRLAENTTMTTELGISSNHHHRRGLG